MCMISIVEKVGAYIDAHALIPSGARVLVGLSGGADSTALLRVLSALAPSGGFSVCAAHFNHQIRPGAAEADEEFSRELSLKLHVPFLAGRADVVGLAKAHSHTLEQEARLLRYGFLARAKLELGCDLIAVAHHMDDQAESILMHLSRGTGLAGLTGMRPKRDDLIRPLLAVRRSEIEAYLSENGFPYCTDETNLVASGTRNRFRLDVIPYIEKHVNPALVPSLCSAAELLLRDEDYLASEAEAALESARREGGYDREALARLPMPIKTRAIRRALSLVGAVVDIEREHVEKVSALLEGETGARLDLHGASVWISYGLVCFGAYPENLDCYELPLAIPGDTAVPGGRFSARFIEGAAFTADPMTAYFDLDLLPRALTVRQRRPGDRFRPLGAPGGRKLKEFFIDKKVPRESRSTPLIASGSEILFVPGFSISESVKVTDGTGRTLAVAYISAEE